MTELVTAPATTRLGDDALCELVNIGAGRALSALSRLVDDAAVTMSPVTLGSTSATTPGQAGVAISLGVEGLRLRFALLFGESDAAAWAARMFHQATTAEAGPPVALGSLEESALLELGNIMSCAFLDTLAVMTRVRLVPGLPTLRLGALDRLLDDERAAARADTVVWTRFVLRDAKVSGRLAVIADGGARSALLRAVLGESPVAQVGLGD